MAKIKLVASDLDGTLLTSDKIITERLKAAIKAITDKGIYFVPATGRVYDAVPEDVKALPVKYVITSNGARVYDPVLKKDIVQNYIPSEDVDFIFDTVSDLHVIIEIFMDNKAYIDENAYRNLSSYNLTDGHSGYILETRIPININELLKTRKAELENINIIFADPETRLDVIRKLKEYGKASVTTSSPNNVEITNLTATKGNALKEICLCLGINKENVLALGDSDNDLDMIVFAGCGVAMANASEHVKDASDMITSSCDENGAALILERLAEKGEI
ncbi:MAG: HAD family phosphatase [Firmicutes bacterium]|nr:HAD family phosphatase [Bacillota bacterium]